jgi:hypothetical protein
VFIAIWSSLWSADHAQQLPEHFLHEVGWLRRPDLYKYFDYDQYSIIASYRAQVPNNRRVSYPISVSRPLLAIEVPCAFFLHDQCFASQNSLTTVAVSSILHSTICFSQPQSVVHRITKQFLWIIQQQLIRLQELYKSIRSYKGDDIDQLFYTHTSSQRLTCLYSEYGGKPRFL